MRDNIARHHIARADAMIFLALHKPVELKLYLRSDEPNLIPPNWSKVRASAYPRDDLPSTSPTALEAHPDLRSNVIPLRSRPFLEEDSAFQTPQNLGACSFARLRQLSSALHSSRLLIVFAVCLLLSTGMIAHRFYCDSTSSDNQVTTITPERLSPPAFEDNGATPQPTLDRFSDPTDEIRGLATSSNRDAGRQKGSAEQFREPSHSHDTNAKFSAGGTNLMAPQNKIAPDPKALTSNNSNPRPGQQGTLEPMTISLLPFLCSDSGYYDIPSQPTRPLPIDRSQKYTEIPDAIIDEVVCIRGLRPDPIITYSSLHSKLRAVLSKECTKGNTNVAKSDQEPVTCCSKHSGIPISFWIANESIDDIRSGNRVEYRICNRQRAALDAVASGASEH